MLSNISNTRVRRGYTPPASANRPPPAGPCAPSQITHPPVQRSRAPPAPVLRWEESPYTCIPLPDVGKALHNSRWHAEVPRLAYVPDAQPQLPPCVRLKPVALPPQVKGVTEVTLHPVLRVGAESRARLAVDFASMPTAESIAGWRSLLLSEPATYPELPSLTVISVLLPWSITVHSSGMVLRCVTVADVVSVIWEALCVGVTEEQFHEWMAQDGEMKPKRMERLESGRKAYRHGMTRLDLLEGKTVFVGLSESVMGCDIWVLNFA
ncbi:hypothetical protein B0H10DRAFT_2049814 [Mycena sp. CBHHK59/15]|nr:hypothetical protein B0H10DRAFT_2049814 [Mycena sp. CBHHK59/15]